MVSPRLSTYLKVSLVIALITIVSWFVKSPGRRATTPATTAAVAAQRKQLPQILAKPDKVRAENDSPSPLVKYRLATAWRSETNTVFGAFANWATTYTNATAAEKIGLVRTGVALAKERRTALRKLIRSEPKTALAQAVPAVVRGQLPVQVTSLLEDRVTGQGDLLVLGRTDAVDGRNIDRRAVVNGNSYEAYVYGDRLTQRSARAISLHGVAVDGDIALSDSPLRVFEEGEPVPASKPLAADSCPISRQPTAPTANGPRPNAVAAESGTHVYWMCHGGHVAAAADGVAAQEAQFHFDSYSTSGNRSALVIKVDFSDVSGESASNADIDNTLSSVDLFFAQASYGDLHLSSHTITPVLRMPRTGRGYRDLSNGDQTLLSDARQAAINAGYSPSQYDFDIVAFPNIGFGWLGQGYVGLKGVWLQTSFTGGAAAHELGHNMGVWHANSWNSTESAISLNGSHEEYGNIFDVMGAHRNFPQAQYNANFKHLYGWLTDEYITTVKSSGTYRLYAHDQASRVPGRAYALKLPAGIVAGGEYEDFWIEFRQLFASRYPATASGAIVQWANDSGTTSASRLLDMNYSTSIKDDAPLALNTTFTDSDLGLSITPIAKGGSGADAYLDIQVVWAAPPEIDLGEALDAPDLSWTTSAVGWIGQRSTSHDGIDAAGSGPIRDNSETYIETSVTGPGTILFWWKVSSEANYDFLSLARDGQELAKISGDVDWQAQSYDVPAGSHMFRWTYRKDAAASAGADRGYVDQVSFTTGDLPPFINSQPVAASVPAGDTASFHVDAIGAAPLSYQWEKLDDSGDFVAIDGATNVTLLIQKVQPSDGTSYHCVLSNSVGTLVSSNAFLTVLSSVPLADALDAPGLTWTTSGAGNWRGESEVSHDGVDAAQSGPIADGKETNLRASIQGPGALTFWWKVSSEQDYDFLKFYFDGDLIEQHSGEFDWTQLSIPVPNGTHRLRWVYVKDASNAEGLDTAWVDEVNFQAQVTNAPTIVVDPGPQTVTAGGTAIFTAQFQASPPVTLTWYKDGAPLTDRAGISGIHSDTLQISNVQPTDEGSYALFIATAFGDVTSQPAALTISTSSLGEAVDQPTRGWLTGGALPWTPQTTTTHDGLDAAMTGSITDSQSTWIKTIVEGPANVSFWWKSSTELSYDIMTFEVDTEPFLTISGPADWRRETFVLDVGMHVLRWKYEKDENTSGGSDAGWLDQVDIAPTLQPPNLTFTSNANGIAVTAQPLPASGQVVLECSTNLLTWTPISTNAINGASMTLTRPESSAAEYVRVRVQ